jgi:hypothetical protein
MKPNGLAKRNPLILLMCEVTKIEKTSLYLMSVIWPVS